MGLLARMQDQARESRIPLVLAALVVLILGASGCTPTQLVALDVAPTGVAVYLNGEELEEIPESLKLKSNRNHTLFFKREGYVSQFVLLRSTGEKGEEVLSPDYVSLELQQKTVKRPNLTLEIEDD